MTSTPFNVGLNENSKLSSRVLQPPGGGHTDIFGGNPEPPKGRRLGPHAKSQIEVTQPVQQQSSVKEAAPQEATPQEAAPQEGAPQSSAIHTPPQPKIEPQMPQTVPKVPPRGRVPPGGFSSGLW